MKKYLFLLVFFITVSNLLFGQQQIVLDENAEPVTISAAFNAIEVSDGIHVFLSQSNSISMAASGKTAGCGKAIKTSISDSVLNISFQNIPGCAYQRSTANAYISFLNLKDIRITNGSQVTLVGNVKGEMLNVKVQSGSSFKGDVSLNQLNLNLSNGSDAKINGKAAKVNIEASNASDVMGYGLVADTCHAVASGASDIFITANAELKASASGASDILYKGNAILINKHSSGSSTIRKKD
ncbi:MAG: DUF2807 domain-containing protein [Chitinophagaceae bacterium]|nr:DUF2807 domain-containing protein [Bacteroidota bacterium]MCC6256751.1 DUF2807 domain-containing protein [Chitinophagaceae bacterium]MCW5915788.1 DUF2807 domain-containing protein [Ferruginibacter sp.]